MIDPTTFPIAARWPATQPDRLQLYSFPTPNGVKVSIALEELRIPYEAHLVDITQNESWSAEFLSLNPNGKIPAILDPDGPDGRSLGLFESGAILVYLAEKAGALMPSDPAARYECLQWLFFQMGGIGPTFSQFNFFYRLAGRDIADKRPLERYRDETRRLLSVLETRLDDREWMMGDKYTIADIATFPWVRALKVFYDAAEFVGLDKMPAVLSWLDRAAARPASQRGLSIPARA